MAERDFETLVKGVKAGKKVLTSEAYEIHNYIANGDTVVIEAIWRGVLAVPVGKLEIGDEMKAFFAQFYEFEEGKIYRQRNYDCFAPFK